MPKREWWGEMGDAIGWEFETMQRVHRLCSSVRATLSNIPKWVLYRLYKNSGSGEMRLMV